jgi:hypothetical protein
LQEVARHFRSADQAPRRCPVLADAVEKVLTIIGEQ